MWRRVVWAAVLISVIQVGFSGYAGGSIGTNQEVTLPYTGYDQRASKERKDSRVKPDHVMRGPLPESFLIGSFYCALIGGAIAATILGVATVISFRPSKNAGANQSHERHNA